MDMTERMIAAIRRIFVGLAIALPLVAGVTAALLLVPPVVALAVTMIGIAGLMVAETFHSRVAAAAGGVLAMGGVLAWALLAAKLVHFESI
jgi:hypothetical protein